MSAPGAGGDWLRRARPLLGTLVEVGIRPDELRTEDAIRSVFDTVADVQACLSRFEPASEVSRFHALRAGSGMQIGRHAQHVLCAARILQAESGGVFDVTLGTAPDGWTVEASTWLKTSDEARVDLGGIAKGYAVDLAIQALMDRGCAAGWVNAGGDIRVFGDVDLPVSIRDEQAGGVQRFATIRDGAFATSHFDSHSRSQAAATGPVRAHVSVAAPSCLWADALTKVVAITGDTAHPCLALHGARAWIHSNHSVSDLTCRTASSACLSGNGSRSS